MALIIRFRTNVYFYSFSKYYTILRTEIKTTHKSSSSDIRIPGTMYQYAPPKPFPVNKRLFKVRNISFEQLSMKIDITRK